MDEEDGRAIQPVQLASVADRQRIEAEVEKQMDPVVIVPELITYTNSRRIPSPMSLERIMLREALRRSMEDVGGTLSDTESNASTCEPENARVNDRMESTAVDEDNNNYHHPPQSDAKCPVDTLNRNLPRLLRFNCTDDRRPHFSA